MAPHPLDPQYNCYRTKLARKLRLEQKARAANPTRNQETSHMASRKDVKYQRLIEQERENQKFEIVEPVDAREAAIAAIAESEEATKELMSSPAAPEWARVVVNETFVAAPKTAAEVQAKIDALEVEHAEALAKLETVRAEQVAAYNEMFAQKKADEDATLTAEAAALPERLAGTLEKIRSFVAPTDHPVVEAPVNHVQRGRDALHRAQINADYRERRAKGEQGVPDDLVEPVYPTPVPGAAPVASTLQDEVKARVAPALAQAAKVQQAVNQWTEAVGASFEALYVPLHGDEMRETIDGLMRGLPATQRNVGLVTGLLNDVRAVIDLKAVVQGTLTTQTREIEKLVAKVDTYGPMTNRGDKSSAAYDFERSLGYALHRLATASPDAVATLWTAARSVTEKLERIEAIRDENAGTVQPALEWQNGGMIVADVQEAARRQARGDGRQTNGSEWSL